MNVKTTQRMMQDRTQSDDPRREGDRDLRRRGSRIPRRGYADSGPPNPCDRLRPYGRMRRSDRRDGHVRVPRTDQYASPFLPNLHTQPENHRFSQHDRAAVAGQDLPHLPAGGRRGDLLFVPHRHGGSYQARLHLRVRPPVLLHQSDRQAPGGPPDGGGGGCWASATTRDGAPTRCRAARAAPCPTTCWKRRTSIWRTANALSASITTRTPSPCRRSCWRPASPSTVTPKPSRKR